VSPRKQHTLYLLLVDHCAELVLGGFSRGEIWRWSTYETLSRSLGYSTRDFLAAVEETRIQKLKRLKAP
jgi:hypothetical protein